MGCEAFNVGIVGAGLSARVFHAPFLVSSQLPVFRLVCFLRSSSEARVEGFEAIPVTTEVDTFLQKFPLDLVIITTPSNSHYPMARLFLNAGKHVVVEKPFCLASREGEELIQLARAKNLLLTVYHNRRWDGDFLTCKRIIQEGRLGRIVEFQSSFDRFRNSIKMVRQSDGSQVPAWKEDESNPANGNLYDLGSHLIDQALQLFHGNSGEGAIVVRCRSRNLRCLQSAHGVADYFALDLEFPSDQQQTAPVLVSLRSSMLAKIPAPRFVIHGTKGSLVIDGVDPQEDQLRSGMDLEDEAFGRSSQGVRMVTIDAECDKDSNANVTLERGQYICFYQNLAEALKNHSREPAVTATQANMVIRVIEAAQKSSASGSSITLK